MKKLLALILACAMCLCLFACASEQTPTETTQPSTEAPTETTGSRLQPITQNSPDTGSSSGCAIPDYSGGE